MPFPLGSHDRHIPSFQDNFPFLSGIVNFVLLEASDKSCCISICPSSITYILTKHEFLIFIPNSRPQRSRHLRKPHGELVDCVAGKFVAAEAVFAYVEDGPVQARAFLVLRGTLGG